MGVMQEDSVRRLAVIKTENGLSLLLSDSKWFSGHWLIGRVLDDQVVLFLYKNAPVAVMPIEELDNVYSSSIVCVGYIDENGDIVSGQPIHVFWQ